ncbi:3-deoxy-7-phosphoheptulonate synthase [Saccharopolyspora taberi]|uniref:Phospho-2-dehydro-3-deoxyheptonate aldolase n=1 Tax=Saccharopolyspora taberi TaxID=60895 RepID=A0ABN3V3R0_9PSEU
MTPGGTARVLRADQQPDWPDPDHLHRVAATLRSRRALVAQEEVDALRRRLAEAAAGRALLLQGGPCAEIFGAPARHETEQTMAMLGRMASTLSEGAELPVVAVGRVAGQYAKPRSRTTEQRHGTVLPAYRGDAVNGTGFSARERAADPDRLLRAYDESAAALRRLRSMAQWCYSSHEALLLDYENSLVRTDPDTRRTYASSGHMLWIGERTRHPDCAHVELAARVNNPFGVKVGPSATPDDLLDLITRINPERTPGKLTLITRLGADRIEDVLPALVDKVRLAEVPVLWVCDPMHGNTNVTETGTKTRSVADIVAEIRAFVGIHRQLGTHPGGLHLEMTAHAVTECLGGTEPVRAEDLGKNYTSACDPRLNAGQAADVASLAAEAWAHGWTRR